MTEKRTGIIKFLAFLALAGTAGYLLFFTPEGNRFLTPEGRKALVERIDLAVGSAGPFGPALFVLIYALGVLALPATPFTACGAFIFGKYGGAVYSILGGTLGASVSFLVGRYLLRDFAHGFLVGRLGDLDRKAEHHGFSIIFYLRILWFPFIVLNYGAGATRIRFRDYFWGTFFGILPAMLIVSLLFGSLKEILASYRGPADLLQFDVLFPLAVLGFSFLLPGIVRRIRGEPLPDAGPAAGSE